MNSIPKELYITHYGDLLKIMREDRGMTVSGLAKEAGVSETNINSWEEGTPPWKDTAGVHDKIADALEDKQGLLKTIAGLDKQEVVIPLRHLSLEVRTLLKYLEVQVKDDDPPTDDEATEVLSFLANLDKEVE